MESRRPAALRQEECAVHPTFQGAEADSSPDRPSLRRHRPEPLDPGGVMGGRADYSRHRGGLHADVQHVVLGHPGDVEAAGRRRSDAYRAEVVVLDPPLEATITALSPDRSAT